MTEPHAEYLNLHSIPEYEYLSFKHFAPGERHTFRTNEKNILLIVTRGTLSFEENGVPVRIHENEYYIQVKGKYQTGNIPSEEANYFFLNFNGELTCNPKNNLPIRGTFDHEKIVGMCEALYAEEQKRKSGLPHLPRPERQMMFFDMLNILLVKNNPEAQQTSVASRIADYVNSHFKENITLDSLCGVFSYSRDYIIHIFREEFAVTPYQYILQRRINYVKHMLDTTDIPIHDLAIDGGFDDVHKLYYLFKKDIGMTPGEYRRSKHAN